MTAARSMPDHPSPKRGAAGPWWLMAGLAAGPFGWITQMLVDYGLSSQLCMLGRGRPGPTPADGEAVALVAINLVCLAMAAAGMFLSWRSWRSTKTEMSGGAEAVRATGERRSRFLAAAGMMAAGVFVLAILFNTVEPFMVPACWSAVL